MKVGDIVKRRPITFRPSFENPSLPAKIMKGEIVYIHPQGRYHVVEFDTPGGKIRESFLGVDD